MKVIPEMRHAH